MRRVRTFRRGGEGIWHGGSLPAHLPPEVRRFVERLRLLKDRTGLSLGAMAAKTAYSASSWQRRPR